MPELTLTAVPKVQTGVLIRRPLAEVYEAFVDPAVTTRFWFSESTGRLEQDAEITWTWAKPEVSARVRVLEARDDRYLHMTWGSGNDAVTDVRWLFDRRSDHVTSVRVEESGFTGTGDEVVARVLDSTIGFTKVLVAAKALLEHDVVVDVIS